VQLYVARFQSFLAEDCTGPGIAHTQVVMGEPTFLHDDQRPHIAPLQTGSHLNLSSAEGDGFCAITKAGEDQAQ